MMSDKLEWTQKLGDAFLAQQDEVMDQIQFLRQKADEAGNLKSNKQQKVTKDTTSDAEPVYVIEPADPDVVYVPVLSAERRLWVMVVPRLPALLLVLPRRLVRQRLLLGRRRHRHRP